MTMNSKQSSMISFSLLNLTEFFFAFRGLLIVLLPSIVEEPVFGEQMTLSIHFDGHFENGLHTTEKTADTAFIQSTHCGLWVNLCLKEYLICQPVSYATEYFVLIQ